MNLNIGYDFSFFNIVLFMSIAVDFFKAMVTLHQAKYFNIRRSYYRKIIDGDELITLTILPDIIGQLSIGVSSITLGLFVIFNFNFFIKVIIFIIYLWGVVKILPYTILVKRLAIKIRNK